MIRSCSKELTSNDLGATGGHQAGIHIPKRQEFLDFFPHLDSSADNPRRIVPVVERDTGERWQFTFLYYNNKLKGGTRDEYRLTGMTKYLRAVNAKAGDRIVFEKDEHGSILVRCEPAEEGRTESLPSNREHASRDQSEDSGEFVIVLSGTWKIVKSRKR